MSTLQEHSGRLGFAAMALATILWAGTTSTAMAHGGGGGGGGHGGGMGGMGGGHMGGMGGHMGGMGYGHMGGMGYGHMGGMGYGHHPGYGYGGLGYGYFPGFFGMGLYGLGFGGYGLGYGLGYGGYGLGYGGYGLGYGGYGGYGYPYYGGLGYPYSTGYGYGYGGYPYSGYGYPAYSGGYTNAMPLTAYSSAYVTPGSGTATTSAQPRILGVDEEPTTLANGRRGMKITNVYPGTAAETAGLKSGDVLISVNGYLTEQHGNLAWIIANATPSNQLKMNVLTAADGQEHTVTATIP